MKVMKKIILWSFLVASLVCLTACGSKCPPARPMMPPAVYLQDVPEPQMRGRTNGDLLAWALEMRAAVRMGNADKKALREWAAGVE